MIFQPYTEIFQPCRGLTDCCITEVFVSFFIHFKLEIAFTSNEEYFVYLSMKTKHISNWVIWWPESLWQTHLSSQIELFDEMSLYDRHIYDLKLSYLMSWASMTDTFMTSNWVIWWDEPLWQTHLSSQIGLFDELSLYDRHIYDLKLSYLMSWASMTDTFMISNWVIWWDEPLWQTHLSSQIELFDEMSLYDRHIYHLKLGYLMRWASMTDTFMISNWVIWWAEPLW